MEALAETVETLAETVETLAETVETLAETVKDRCGSLIRCLAIPGLGRFMRCKGEGSPFPLHPFPKPMHVSSCVFLVAGEACP